eukprot:TRINITY_DN46991_c0_g1_i1.p1 TRINITY_DN46991_c0_g1~~TRINITY_DN46991_c0_g1_i1.p1  ORF type:complete len:1132 (+),score=278.67 TRINITY_DN46991_c0_g1_i1:76-3396(+)
MAGRGQGRGKGVKGSYGAAPPQGARGGQDGRRLLIYYPGGSLSRLPPLQPKEFGPRCQGTEQDPHSWGPHPNPTLAAFGNGRWCSCPTPNCPTTDIHKRGAVLWRYESIFSDEEDRVAGCWGDQMSCSESPRTVHFQCSKCGVVVCDHLRLPRPETLILSLMQNPSVSQAQFRAALQSMDQYLQRLESGDPTVEIPFPPEETPDVPYLASRWLRLGCSAIFVHVLPFNLVGSGSSRRLQLVPWYDATDLAFAVRRLRQAIKKALSTVSREEATRKEMLPWDENAPPAPLQTYSVALQTAGVMAALAPEPPLDELRRLWEWLSFYWYCQWTIATWYRGPEPRREELATYWQVEKALCDELFKRGSVVRDPYGEGPAVSTVSEVAPEPVSPAEEFPRATTDQQMMLPINSGTGMRKRAPPELFGAHAIQVRARRTMRDLPVEHVILFNIDPVCPAHAALYPLYLADAVRSHVCAFRPQRSELQVAKETIVAIQMSEGGEIDEGDAVLAKLGMPLRLEVAMRVVHRLQLLFGFCSALNRQRHAVSRVVIEALTDHRKAVNAEGSTDQQRSPLHACTTSRSVAGDLHALLCDAYAAVEWLRQSEHADCIELELGPDWLDATHRLLRLDREGPEPNVLARVQVPAPAGERDPRSAPTLSKLVLGALCPDGQPWAVRSAPQLLTVELEHPEGAYGSVRVPMAVDIANLGEGALDRRRELHAAQRAVLEAQQQHAPGCDEAALRTLLFGTQQVDGGGVPQELAEELKRLGLLSGLEQAVQRMGEASKAAAEGLREAVAQRQQRAEELQKSLCIAAPKEPAVAVAGKVAEYFPHGEPQGGGVLQEAALPACRALADQCVAILKDPMADGPRTWTPPSQVAGTMLDGIAKAAGWTTDGPVLRYGGSLVTLPEVCCILYEAAMRGADERPATPEELAAAGFAVDTASFQRLTPPDRTHLLHLRKAGRLLPPFDHRRLREADAHWGTTPPPTRYVLHAAAVRGPRGYAVYVRNRQHLARGTPGKQVWLRCSWPAGGPARLGAPPVPCPTSEVVTAMQGGADAHHSGGPCGVYNLMYLRADCAVLQDPYDTEWVPDGVKEAVQKSNDELGGGGLREGA